MAKIVEPRNTSWSGKISARRLPVCLIHLINKREPTCPTLLPGGDTDDEHDPGRSDGQAVYHTPQRPQHGSVHESRPRTVPQGICFVFYLGYFQKQVSHLLLAYRQKV